MKSFVRVVVCAGLSSLVGCGGEDGGSFDAESVETSEEAASAAIFISGKIRVNNVNTSCRVTAGSVLKLGGWTPTTPSATIACWMPPLFDGQPWDTTRLRQITYHHPAGVTDKVSCSIVWRNKSNNAFAAQTPPLESFLNSPSHQVAGAEYYTNGDGWVRSVSAGAFNWELVCRIPNGAFLYSYTYSYEDTI